MKKPAKHLGLVLAITSALLVSSPASAKKESGYLFEQYSDYWGPQTTYVTGSGLYVHSPKLELTMFMRAPDWKVFCFNSKNKTYITCGHKEWAQKFVGPTGPRDEDWQKLDAAVTKVRLNMDKGILPQCGDIISPEISIGRSGTICGRKALQVFMTGHTSLIYPPYAKSVEFWVIPDLKFSASMVKAVSETDGLPQCVGLPIDLYRHGGKGKTLTQYKTSKIEKVMVDDSLFKLPAGYKLAEDEMSLVTDDGGLGKGGLADVFGDDLGDIDDPSAGKKPSPAAGKKSTN